MVFRYSTEQKAIEAMQRIATAEGFPKQPKAQTLYYLNYQSIGNDFYIDARSETNKHWYNSEAQKCDLLIPILPIDPQPIPIM